MATRIVEIIDTQVENGYVWSKAEFTEPMRPLEFRQETYDGKFELTFNKKAIGGQSRWIFFYNSSLRQTIHFEDGSTLSTSSNPENDDLSREDFINTIYEYLANDCTLVRHDASLSDDEEDFIEI